MATSQIVIDTNILIAGLRSRRGSAFRLLTLVGTGQFGIHLSVPLVLEYKEVLLRELLRLQVAGEAVEDLIDFHCFVATRHPIFFLWRPFLPDPGDDRILELAVKAGCEFIVTYNTRDFAGVEQFGVRALNQGRSDNILEHCHEYTKCPTTKFLADPPTGTCGTGRDFS